MENDDRTCKHDQCSCAVAEGGDYCSPQCETADGNDMTGIKCDCGHPGCAMEV